MKILLGVLTGIAVSFYGFTKYEDEKADTRLKAKAEEEFRALEGGTRGSMRFTERRPM